jgi:stage III sporulation protein SpoIIIAA
VKIKDGLQAEYDVYVASNSRDSYSMGVVTFGERWASVMEVKIDAEEKLEDIAEQTSSLADTEGISGFMYGYAVEALAHFWIYGEELRRWHNIATQLHNEGERANESGGVLNPALMVISDE